MASHTNTYNNQINEYHNNVSMIQAPLIQDPSKNKYVEVNNVKDTVKIDELNEIIENYEKEKISIMNIIIIYLENMI